MEATLNLGDRLERFVEEQIREGRFADASEVVRAGLLLLGRSLEQEDEPPHDPEAYDRWFRTKVEEALREADDPNAVWIPHEDVVAEMDREIAEIEAELERETAASR